jgi:hypothetical protein
MVPSRIRRPGTWKERMIRELTDTREVDRTTIKQIVRRVSTFMERSPASRPRGEAANAVRVKSSQPCKTRLNSNVFRGLKSTEGNNNLLLLLSIDLSVR